MQRAFVQPKNFLLLGAALLAGFAFSASNAEAATSTWNGTYWTERVILTIDPTNIDEALTDFPVYVDLADMPAAFWSGVSAGGGDIRVMSSDLLTEMPREVVFASTTAETGELHFRANSISASSDTVFYIYYNGSTTAEYAVTDTYGRNNVWTNDFDAVFHMHEDPGGTAPQMIDSTGDHDGTTDSLASSDSVSGQLGQSVQHDGGTLDRMYASGFTNLGTTNKPYAVAAWFRPDSGETAGNIVHMSNSLGGTGWCLPPLSITGSNLQAYSWDGSGSAAIGATTITAETWNMGYSQWDATNGLQAYLNGQFEASTTQATYNASGASNYIHTGFSPGSCSGNQGAFDGAIDEVRIASTTRTAAWIKAEYENQSVTTDFYTLEGITPWNSTDWFDYETITIGAANIDETLTDFPVYVDLSDLSGAFWSMVRDDGADIRVTTDAGVEVPHELVSIATSTETGELHFKATSLSSSASTIYRIYYNGTTALSYPDSYTYGAQNVWTNDYIAVYHLEESANTDVGGYLDATANSYDGTGVSMSLTDATSRIAGNAAEFDGVSDYIDLGTQVNLASLTSLTTSAWVNYDSSGSTEHTIVSNWEDAASNASVLLRLEPSNDTVEGFVRDTVTQQGGTLTGTSVTPNQWEFVSLRLDSSGDGLDALVGETESSNNFSAGAFVSSASPEMFIGATPHTTLDDFTGSIDEVRIASTARSNAWIAAEYVNQSTTTDFYTVGSVIPITVSGTLYESDGSTPVATSSVIKVAAGSPAVVYTGTSTAGTGAWSVLIEGGHTVDAGSGIVAWVDGDPNIRGALVTVANSSTTDITSQSIYQDHVISRHESSISSTTISAFDTYDAGNDSDIFFTADTAGDSLLIQTGQELYIWPGTTLNIGTQLETVAGPTLPGSVEIGTGATLETADTFKLAGNLINNGTITNDDDDTLEVQAGQSVSFRQANLGTPDGMEVWGTVFADSGTKLATVELTGGLVSMYTLSTAYDATTASLLSQYNISSFGSIVTDVAFNATGSEMYILSASNQSVYAFDLGTDWDVSTASSTDTLSLTSTVFSPYGFAFNTTGTKLFIVDPDSDDVGEYTLSTAWDISSASYVDAFSVAGQQNFASGITFSPDGTSFVIGNLDSDSEAHQYNLSVGYDISTASFGGTLNTSNDLGASTMSDVQFDADGDEIFFTIGQAMARYSLDTAYSLGGVTYNDFFTTTTNSNDPYVIHFSETGDKMFLLDRNDTDIDEYSLSTNFDASSASYVDSFDVSGEDSSPYGMTFNATGSRVYISGDSTGYVYEYDLSTPWDISTASSTNSLDTAFNVYGIEFNDDGSILFVGTLSGGFDEYTLTSNYDISTASYSTSNDISSLNNFNFPFNASGSKIYIPNGSDNDTEIYTLSTDFDPSTAGAASTYTFSEADGYALHDIAFDDTGDTAYVLVAGVVFEYSLSEPYTFGGATYTDFESYTQNGTFLEAAAFNNDGSKAYVIYGSTVDRIGQFTLSTPYDVSTMTHERSLYLGNVDTTATDIQFSATGSKMYILGDGSNDVTEYYVSTPYDISTAVVTDVQSVNSEEGTPDAFTFSATGDKMFVTGPAGDDINEYTLATAWDVSTASFVDSFDVSAEDNQPADLAFNADGTTMFVLGDQNASVYEYDLSAGFDVSTAAYTNRKYDFSGFEIQPSGLAFNPNGEAMYVIGVQSREINEFSLASDFTFESVTATSTFSGTVTGSSALPTTTVSVGTLVFSGNASTSDLTVNTGAALELGSTGILTAGGDVALNGTFSAGDKLYLTGGDNTVSGTLTGTNALGAIDVTGRYTFSATTELTDLTIASGGDVTAPTILTVDGGLTNNGSFSANSGVVQISAATEKYRASNLTFQNATTVPQASISNGLAFNADGTKLYVLDNHISVQSREINEYNLSSPYDITTAAFDSFFSFASQESSPRGFVFNSDGTKLFLVGGSGDDVNEYTLSTAYDISTLSFIDATSVSSQVASPFDIEFNLDGTQMFIADSGAEIAIYSLSTGFDASTASFVATTSGAFPEFAGVTSIEFNPDGTKVFVTDYNPAVVYEYDLSTAFDPRTTTFVASSTVQVGGNFAAGLEFNNDGSRLFSVLNGGIVNEFTATAIGDNTISGSFTGNSALNDMTILASSSVIFASAASTSNITINNLAAVTAPSTGLTILESFTNDGSFVNTSGTLYFDGSVFQVSTLEFDDEVSVAQSSVPEGIVFNNDGTKMFVVGSSFSDEVNEYSLSTPFNIGTASYVTDFSVSAQDTTPTGVAFSATGTRMFVIGQSSRSIHEYELATAFDVSTAVYTHATSVSAQEFSPEGLRFNTDGTKVFVIGFSGDDANEYTLGTAWDISTASFVDATTLGQDTIPTDIDFSADGMKMFTVGDTGNDINEYTLSSAFDASTRTFIDSFSVATQDTTPLGMSFNNSGTEMYVVGDVTNRVYRYVLDTAYDVSTAFFDGTFKVNSQDTSPTGLTFNADGTKAYVSGDIGNDINEYSLSTGFDISTASFVHATTVATQESSPQDVAFNADGTKMFVVGSSGDDVGEYSLGIAFDISTASFVHATSVNAQNTIPLGVDFSSDGTKMFVVGSTPDRVSEYTLSTAFDVSTANHVTDFSVTLQDSAPTDVLFNAEGSRMFVLGASGDDVNEYSLSTNYSLSTASFIDSYSVSSQESTPTGMAFNAEGTKLFIVGSGGDEINEYDLDSPTASGTLSGTTNLGNVSIPGAVVFQVNASTSDFTIGTDGSVTLPDSMTVVGSFDGQGTIAVGTSTITLTGTSETLSGTITNADNLVDTVLTGEYTFNNATTADITIASGATLSGSGELVVLGDYTNNGSYGSGGTVVFNGNTTQTATGTLTGTGAFDGLRIDNDSAASSDAPAVIFGSAVSTDGRFTMTASTSAQFVASETATFDSVNWTGNVLSPVYLRSSNPGTAWNLDVTNAQASVQFVDVADSNATAVNGGVTAFESFDSGNNTNWNFSFELPPEIWNSTDWTNRIALTISASAIDEPLTDFPVYVDLADLPADFWNGVSDSCGDVRIMNSNLSDEMPREIVSCDTSLDTGEMHFRADTIASTTDTTFYIYYNGSSPDYASTAAYGTQNVWSNDYIGVWHLGEGDSTAADFYQDSTSNAHDGQLVDTDGDTAATSGLFGGAMNFNGDADYIDLGYTSNIGANNFTYTMWLRAETTHQIDTESTSGTGGIAGQTYVLYPDQAVSNGGAGLSVATNGISVYEHGSGYMPALAVWENTDSDWQHVSVTYSAKQPTIYYNGSSTHTGLTSTRSNVYAVGEDTSIGGGCNVVCSSSGYFDGDLDEVRIASTTRSAGWISAEYLNQSTTTDFYTVAERAQITLSDSDAGQVANAFSFQNQTNEPLFSFKLTPTVGDATASQIIFTLPVVEGVDTDEVSNWQLYRDINSDGSGTSSEPTIGGSGVFTIDGSTGSVTFSSSWAATTTGNYVLTANLTSIDRDDAFVITLSDTSITAASTNGSGAAIFSGTVSSVQHIRSGSPGGGGSGGSSSVQGSIGGDEPAGDGDVGGGGDGGGGEIGEVEDGDNIANDPDYNAPSETGSTFNTFTNPANVYVSDGTDATSASTQKQSYGNFGFSIPSGNEITGISVKVDVSATDGSGSTVDITLSHDGGTTETAERSTGTLTTSDVVYIVGGPGDTWGRTWSPSEFNDGNFEVIVEANPGDVGQVDLDAIQVQVHHQTSGGGSGGGGSI